MQPSLPTILSTAKDFECLFGKVKDKLFNNLTEVSTKMNELPGEQSLVLEFIELKYKKQ
jgi:hypothetical protein